MTEPTPVTIYDYPTCEGVWQLKLHDNYASWDEVTVSRVDEDFAYDIKPIAKHVGNKWIYLRPLPEPEPKIPAKPTLVLARYTSPTYDYEDIPKIAWGFLDDFMNFNYFDGQDCDFWRQENYELIDTPPETCAEYSKLVEELDYLRSANDECRTTIRHLQSNVADLKSQTAEKLARHWYNKYNAAVADLREIDRVIYEWYKDDDTWDGCSQLSEIEALVQKYAKANIDNPEQPEQCPDCEILRNNLNDVLRLTNKNECAEIIKQLRTQCNNNENTISKLSKQRDAAVADLREIYDCLGGSNIYTPRPPDVTVLAIWKITSKYADAKFDEQGMYQENGDQPKPDKDESP